MKPLTLFRAVLGTTLLLAATMAQAEIASGDYSVSFNGDLNIWDISGTYSEELEDFSMNYTINLEPSGKFKGSGYASYDEGWNYLNADLLFSGTIKSAGSVVRVTINMKMSGSGEVSGYYATFTASMKETLEIDTNTHMMWGTVSGKISVKVPGYGSESGAIPKTSMQTELPVDMTGTWDLGMNVVTNGTKYTGSGAIELSNEKTIPFDLKGTYSAKKDTSKLTLKGVDLNKCMSLSLGAAVTNAQFNVQTLKGKVLGQKLTIQPAK